ncbi:hypothetical protein SBI_02948 [Streptomyces bingchenggensis BCW-1]|uniref:Uncharacterized protein n=1 Tax=Streptomyces bingchenggensis (strain BCW-1) TaxID=749414 RepID=D7C4L8_STRBB|nr:hypothetical protein SBI_02948 [Streptomyces bingchenggensis BCW-1]
MSDKEIPFFWFLFFWFLGFGTRGTLTAAHDRAARRM